MAYEAASALAYERLFHRAALSPALAASLDDGAAIDPARYDAAREDAKRIGATVAIAMAGLDAVLAPAALDEAPLGLGATGDPVFCRPWTLLLLPCLTSWSPGRAAMLVCSRSPALSRRPCHEDG